MGHRELAAGEVVDDLYRIRGVLGRGGLSTVYEAADLDGGEDRALKAVHGGDVAVRRRFLDELMLGRRIRHPNVVRLDDYGTLNDGGPYLVMERLRGRTLAQTLRQDGPIALERLIPLFLGAIDALAAAHRLGIVHRDLKPGNLLLAGGSLVVLDFGVSHRGEGRRGGIPRTLGYSPPEVFRGEATDPRIDVYQLGVVLAEGLTGRRLFRGPDPLPAQLGGLPEGLLRGPIAAIVARALSPSPEKRYADASALGWALRAALGDAPSARSGAASTLS